MDLGAAPNVSRSALSLLARSAFRRRPRRRLDVRQLLAVPVLGAVAVLTLLVAPAVASADSASTLTVVGTSDLSDSGLEPNLIQPEFNKAFPQFTLKYIGSATGAAIQSAENGNGGPSALIVHAPALENQFVANGYSYNNQYGNAIFTNDFVLAGPTGDPAGVASNAAHNIAQAFADIATAGNSGTATFLSRGGTTTASGTTVEEHQLWALLHGSGLQPSSLVLCDVSTADGGGMTPIKSTVQATSGQPCPDNGTVNGTDAPAWYAITGVSQAANVIEANACPSPPAPSGQPTCYVLTDRGTFDYLASGTDTARHDPEPQDRHPRQQPLGSRRRERADQLLPRLHHQPVKAGRDREPDRRPGLHQLPHLPGVPVAAEDLPPNDRLGRTCRSKRTRRRT